MASSATQQPALAERVTCAPPLQVAANRPSEVKLAAAECDEVADPATEYMEVRSTLGHGVFRGASCHASCVGGCCEVGDPQPHDSCIVQGFDVCRLHITNASWKPRRPSPRKKKPRRLRRKRTGQNFLRLLLVRWRPS